ncbi:hypothetical protein NQZ68_018431 [Dissostichus eleginoides]|nr:hypothetical protein NQZ68_018431 [Dissostichus eleginoides]
MFCFCFYLPGDNLGIMPGQSGSLFGSTGVKGQGGEIGEALRGFCFPFNLLTEGGKHPLTRLWYHLACLTPVSVFVSLLCCFFCPTTLELFGFTHRSHRPSIIKAPLSCVTP